jgi:general L-amino acid transport system substrate-binding protein
MRRTTKSSLTLLVLFALLGAGCTNDGDSSSDTTTPGDTTATSAASGGDTAAPPATSETSDSVEEVQSSDSRLDTVQDNGVFRCGTRDDLPGFASLDPSGEHVGFDSDFCRVIAAAVLGDATAVEMVDVATDDRFTALQSGEIDALVRNTTWTATRDGVEGATFLQTTFYDGQGMMVAADSGFESIADMDGVIVCVAQGTTTEGNAAAEAAKLGVTWEVRAFEDVDLIQEAFVAGQCDGWSSDTSQLTGLRSTYPDGPDALKILPEVFSKEPLGPAVADGDSRWAQAVNWAILATITAEELGITSENVDTFATTDDVTIQRFLGQAVEGEAVLDPGLGLPTDFAYQVVSQVGNYGEIFERHLAPLGLERGVNALWSDGGLIYSPPYR